MLSPYTEGRFAVVRMSGEAVPSFVLANLPPVPPVNELRLGECLHIIEQLAHGQREPLVQHLKRALKNHVGNAATVFWASSVVHERGDQPWETKVLLEVPEVDPTRSSHATSPAEMEGSRLVGPSWGIKAF